MITQQQRRNKQKEEGGRGKEQRAGISHNPYIHLTIIETIHYYFLSPSLSIPTKSFPYPNQSDLDQQKDLEEHDEVHPSIDSVVEKTHVSSVHEEHLAEVANSPGMSESSSDKKEFAQACVPVVKASERVKMYLIENETEVE